MKFVVVLHLAISLCCCSAFGPSHSLLLQHRPSVERVVHSGNSATGNLVVGNQKRQVTTTTTTLTTVSFPADQERSFGSIASGPSTMVKSFWLKFKTNPVWHWRLIYTSFFSSLVIFRNFIDYKLIGFWNFLLFSQALPARIFRTDSWEWCWAISCLVVFIHSFGLADKLVRKADGKGIIHPWKKYRLQDRYEADKRRRMLQSESLRSGDENVPAGVEEGTTHVRVKHSNWHWKSWVNEFWVYAAPLLVWDILAPRRHRRIGGFGPPTTMGILGGIVGGLLMYDILFFCGHYLMHKVPFLYRTFHAKHHESREVRACDTVRLNIGEEVYDVVCSIAALNYLGVHPVARTIYNMVITFLLTELHCGFDFPWSPQNVIPGGIATGSRRHHYHHRYGKHYYQKFFFTADRLFGFFPKNDGSLQGDSVKSSAYTPQAWKEA